MTSLCTLPSQHSIISILLVRLSLQLVYLYGTAHNNADAHVLAKAADQAVLLLLRTE
jgi:hypothetical protein